MTEQMTLGVGQQGAPTSSRPRKFRAGSRTIRVSECFDTYWRFAAERQRVFHARAAGDSPPWTNRIETWELLSRELGETPSWEGFEYSAYERILTAAMRRGERVYSAAYIVPNPAYGQTRKHGNHLRLLEQVMVTKLNALLADAGSLSAVYELLLDLPSLGPFLAYQYAIDLAYTPVVVAEENDFVVPGPGALDGISKCFLDTAVRGRTQPRRSPHRQPRPDRRLRMVKLNDDQLAWATADVRHTPPKPPAFHSSWPTRAAALPP